MNSEEYLDRLLEMREHREVLIPVANDEVVACLAAGEALTQLQKVDVPPEFAGRLEFSIRGRARGLALQNGSSVSIARHQNFTGLQRFQMSRAWIAVGIAAVLVLACVGVLTVSAQSLPGDALYSVKQAEDQFNLTFASDPRNRASVQINQLHNSLVDLDTVVNDKRDDDAIRFALHIVAARTDESRAAVAMLPAGTERDAAQQGLDGVLAEEEQVLRQLLELVDWPVRVAVTRQLGALGDPVPTLTRIVVSIQPNGARLITLTGTNFAPHVEFIINGRPAGIVSSTSLQVVAVISSSAWSAGEHTFGVLNPDGTAAQIALDGDDDQEFNPQGGNHSRMGTPEPKGNFDD